MQETMVEKVRDLSEALLSSHETAACCGTISVVSSYLSDYFHCHHFSSPVPVPTPILWSFSVPLTPTSLIPSQAAAVQPHPSKIPQSLECLQILMRHVSAKVHQFSTGLDSSFTLRLKIAPQKDSLTHQYNVKVTELGGQDVLVGVHHWLSKSSRFLSQESADLSLIYFTFLFCFGFVLTCPCDKISLSEAEVIL